MAHLQDAIGDEPQSDIDTALGSGIDCFGDIDSTVLQPDGLFRGPVFSTASTSTWIGFFPVFYG